MCGPTGVGVLYGKYHLLEEMTPTRFGGGSNARYNSCGLVKLKNAPTKFETGTPNIEGVIGLGSAIEYLQNIGMKNIEEHENASDFRGNMVHYVISGRSNEAVRDMAETLIQNLIKANRVSSRRLELITEIEPDMYSTRNYLEDIIDGNLESDSN